jgi:predicted nucleic acid-binding Zn ribbon protein
MNEKKHALACIECGEPIPGSASWVCSPRCSAVMNLVQYGRTSRDGSLVWPDKDRLKRLGAQAGVIGHFPTWNAWVDLKDRDKERCQYEKCHAHPAEMIDWRDDDPVLTRPVRSEELRTICTSHQRAEALRRFVGVPGQVARTAPAIWARIEATEPLVLRDDVKLWTNSESWSLLHNWPLASETTRRDLHDWVEALGQVPPKSRRAAPDVVGGGPDDFVGEWNTALDRLSLPSRRRHRLVRAIHALMVQLQAVEGTREALYQSLSASMAQVPPADAQSAEDGR